MRFKEFKRIKEAPISDFQPMGDWDYDHEDEWGDEYEEPWKAGEKKKIFNPQWKQKVYKSWSKTKNDYILIPVSGEATYNPEILERGVVTVDDLFQEFEEGFDQLVEMGVVDAETMTRTPQHKDKTVVFFLGNAADNWIAVSGWMLLHRLGHGSRTTQGEENPAYSAIVTAVFEGLHSIFGNFGVDLQHNPRNPNKMLDDKQAKWADYGLQKIMTTGSARKGVVRDRYEGIYEMWAQYLNRGAVQLRAPDTLDIENVTKAPNPRNEQELTDMDKSILEGYIEDLQDQLNDELFPAFEDSIKGEIILM